MGPPIQSSSANRRARSRGMPKEGLAASTAGRKPASGTATIPVRASMPSAKRGDTNTSKATPLPVFQGLGEGERDGGKPELDGDRPTPRPRLLPLLTPARANSAEGRRDS